MGHSIKYSVSTSRVWQDTQSYIRPQPVKVTRRQQLEEGWAGRRRLGQMLWPRRFGRPSPCSRCTWTPSSAWEGGWSWSWLPNSTDFFIGFLFRCCQLMPDQISDWSARWRPGRWWPRPWWLSDICHSPKKVETFFGSMKKWHTCPGRTSSQRCRPSVESRSWSQSFSRTAAGRRRGRCSRDSSGSPPHGQPPLCVSQVYAFKVFCYIGTAERCYQHFRDLITSICPTERSKPFYGDLKQTKAEPGTARYSQVQPGTGDIRGATFISAAVC